MPRARTSWRGSPRPAPAPAAIPPSVTLVAVSKTVPPEALRDAVAAGLDLLGENRVQEAAAKVAAGAGRPLAPRRAAPVEQGASGAGGLRRRSSRSIRSKLARRLDRLVPETRPGRRYPVLVEVNVDRDPAKAGFDPRHGRCRDGGASRAAASRRARADDGRPADVRPRRGPADVRGPARASRTAAAHAGPSSVRSCRWG